MLYQKPVFPERTDALLNTISINEREMSETINKLLANKTTDIDGSSHLLSEK